MKKLILAFMLFFTMSFASATDIDTRGLSKAQEAELTIQAEKMKEQGAAPVVEVQKAVSNVQAVSQWAEAGKSLAVGLGAGAKEIGVAVNEFADTRVGRITTYIIIWKLLGKDLLGLFMGFLILFIVIPVMWKTAIFFIAPVVEYEDCKFLWFKIRRRKSISFRNMEDGDTVIFIGTCVATLMLFICAMHSLPY